MVQAVPVTVLWRKNGGPLLLSSVNAAVVITDLGALRLPLKVDIQCFNGVLSLLNETVGLTVTASARNLTLIGFQASVNEAMAKLVYTPDLGFGGSDTVNVYVDDIDPRPGFQGVTTFTFRIAMTGMVVRLGTLNRASVSTVQVTLQEEVPLANELRLSLPPDFVPRRCGDGYQTCSMSSTLLTQDALNQTLFVGHSFGVDGRLVRASFTLNATLRGTSTFLITNVLLPNHCRDATFTLDALRCDVDRFGMRDCLPLKSWTTTFVSGLDQDGVPQKCSVCNACRSTPYGVWDCNQDNVRVAMPNFVSSCPQ